jgi:hypothetical protein
MHLSGKVGWIAMQLNDVTTEEGGFTGSPKCSGNIGQR